MEAAATKAAAGSLERDRYCICRQRSARVGRVMVRVRGAAEAVLSC
jgi:hypothetical protein